LALTKWDPFKDLLFLQDRMSRIFDEALMKYKGAGGGGAWFPPVDIYETEELIILKAELPGIDMNSVDIEVKDSTITLRGERKLEKNLKEENYHRMERFYGTFQRAFNLPYMIDRNDIKASLKDGVLKITVPKYKEAKIKAIKVQVL
jgi:HSP20 family protein